MLTNAHSKKIIVRIRCVSESSEESITTLSDSQLGNWIEKGYNFTIYVEIPDWSYILYDYRVLKE